ncbi:MAG: hypothetical protein JW924_08450 [Fusobacteriaceae bacterium]|nr:hypothetical protein [Fusobacteriaceae bacterium]
MFNEKEILRILNKKYFINEYIYIIKKFKESYSVLIIDNLNKRVYIEDEYPESLIKESKVNICSRKDFLEEISKEVVKIMETNYSDIYNEILSFSEQKSLF